METNITAWANRQFNLAGKKMAPWVRRHINDRKLITSKEDRISLTQLIGFALILVGVLYILYKIFIPDSGADSISGEEIAIIFFIIMLGVSFAFPSLLQDQSKNLSTMRIIVFMMANVICLLLLKIGWEVDDFSEIKIDQYWVGIIAFVFGAKATQAFFESKMAVPKQEPSSIGVAGLAYSQADVAKFALEQNQQILMHKFPNIVSISDAVHDMNQKETHVIAIYLEDSDISGIPDILEVKMPDGTTNTIATELIKNVGTGEIHCSQFDDYQTQRTSGSICCMAKTSNGKEVLVTSGHIYSQLKLLNYGGWISKSDQKDVHLKAGKKIGEWIFQQITDIQDIGFIELGHQNTSNDLVRFGDNGYYEVSDHSIKKEAVTLISKESGKRAGFILDHNTGWFVNYANENQLKSKIILVGSTTNRSKSKTLSKSGDSGGAVYQTESGKLVGIILGGNKKYTWVLPIKETLDYFKLKLI